MREFKGIVYDRFKNNNQIVVVLLLILSLSFSGFCQNKILNNSESNSYNTLLEELKDAPFLFVDYSEVVNSNIKEVFSFQNNSDESLLFEFYLQWKNDDCYWTSVADSDNYSMRKNTKTELIFIKNTGGDNFLELRFVKKESEILYATNEYLNGELVEFEKPLLKLIKVKRKPLKICNKE